MSDRPPLADRLAGRWREALMRLGIEERFLSKRQGPCPVCGGKDRFRWDDKEGRGTFYCNQCGPGSGADLAMKVLRLDFAGLMGRLEEHYPELQSAGSVRRPAPPDPRLQRIRALWASGKPLDGSDPASVYLQHRAGQVPLSAELRVALHVAYHAEGALLSHYPCLLALVRDAEGATVNVQRTYLSPIGRKANVPEPRKLMAGTLPAGSAIRLTEIDEEMGAAEGLETALSAEALSGVPCWSLITAANLAAWTPPAGVRRLVVFGDHDKSFTGQAAAYTLARRTVARRGPSGESLTAAEVRLPPAAGEDWNDVHRMAVQVRPRP